MLLYPAQDTRALTLTDELPEEKFRWPKYLLQSESEPHPFCYPNEDVFLQLLHPFSCQLFSVNTVITLFITFSTMQREWASAVCHAIKWLLNYLPVLADM